MEQAAAPVPFPSNEEEREALIEVLVVAGQDDGRRWQIQDKGCAAWAVRKVAAIRADQAENKRIYDAEAAPLLAQLAKLQAWLTSENQTLESRAGFFTTHLEQFHRSLMASDPKTPKTIKLPQGEISLRAQAPEMVYDDEALVAWLQFNRPELVRTKTEPVKADLKKVIDLRPADEVPDGQLVAVDKETGEIVAGVTAVERPQKFELKVSL